MLHYSKENEHIQKRYHQIQEGNFDICLDYHPCARSIW